MNHAKEPLINQMRGSFEHKKRRCASNSRSVCFHYYRLALDFGGKIKFNVVG